MKSSKHVANNDFDDKLTIFRMKNNFWTKISKNGHCEMLQPIFLDRTVRIKL